MPIQRIEASVARLGNDEIYGNGSDGTVVVSSSSSISRDMYYQNLTINPGVTLNTNGFRVFVKNTLTLNGTIGVPAGSSASTGTVAGTTAAATSTTNSLGGSAAGATYTASTLSPSVYDWIDSLLNAGARVRPSGVVAISGGAGGANGVAGTRTPATAGTGATNGGAGAAGKLALRAAGQSGGPGTAGTPGTNGQAGSTPPAAAAGVAGIGGAIVFIAAKVIAGSGAIRSEGQNAVAGGSSATGTGATNGTAGSAGAKAPDVAVAHHVDNHLHYDYPGGHASASAPALPHDSNWYFGDSPPSATEQTHIHRWVHGNHIHHSSGGHYDHGFMCEGGHGGNFSHTYNYSDNRPNINYANFNFINGIPHHSPVYYNTGHHFNDTGVVFPHCSWVAHYDAKGNAVHWSGSWPRQHYDNYTHYIIQAPQTVKYAGHITAVGGNGGAAGAAGTNGTNGSTTAGTNGQSGGGGGIVCITDDSIPGTITTSTAGGTLSGASGASGTLVTIINK